MIDLFDRSRQRCTQTAGDKRLRRSVRGKLKYPMTSARCPRRQYCGFYFLSLIYFQSSKSAIERNGHICTATVLFASVSLSSTSTEALSILSFDLNSYQTTDGSTKTKSTKRCIFISSKKEHQLSAQWPQPNQRHHHPPPRRPTSRRLRHRPSRILPSRDEQRALRGIQQRHT